MDELDYIPATEEEIQEHNENLVNEMWERWFEMVAWNYPEREGFEF
jgi:hypothetical protein